MKKHPRTIATFKTLAVALGLAGLCAAPVVQAQDGKVKIGFITDMSSLYADVEGKNGAVAIQMAIDDFGGKVLGMPIELVSADHQNKADIAASKAREWIDTQGLTMLFGGTNSGTALAMAKVAQEKKRVFIVNGAGTSALTNEQCSPYTVQYAYDTVALAKGTGGAVVQQGGRDWFFLTADYAFGAALEADTAKVVKEKGGRVLGSVKHPLNASDFSSFLLQAQNSKAQILGLANAGGDTINAIKAAREFGINKSMKMAGLLVFLTDIHSLGLKNTEGLLLTTSWDWNLDDKTRAFGRKFFAKTKRMPTDIQAADYSATMNYPQGGGSRQEHGRRQGDGKAQVHAHRRLLRQGQHPPGRPLRARHVPDAGEVARRIQGAVGLLQGGRQAARRPGVDHQGRKQVRALEVTRSA